MSAQTVEADTRVGGPFRLEASKPEGRHVVGDEYREFVRDQRVVMTWVYDGPMASAGKMEALFTVEFREDRPNTEISLSHDGLTNPVYLETIRNGAWTKALDELEAVLVDRARGERTPEPS